MRLRPALFDLEDQEENDKITYALKKTAILAGAGFFATSSFRIWQIKTQSKNISLGVAAIILSYMPAYAYYSYQTY
jgi:hypothetical protein